MTQTSRLVLEIDSRDAEQKAADTRKALEALEALGIPTQRSMEKAAAGIDGVGKSSAKATGSVDELSDSSGKAAGSNQRIGETAAQAQARLLAMAKSSLEASEYVRALSISTEKAGGSFDFAADKAKSLTDLAKRLRAESDANVGTSNKQAEAVRKTASATGTYSEELEKLLGKLDPVRGKQLELMKQQKQLAGALKSGDLDPAGYKKFSGIIADNASAMNDFSLATKGSQRDAAQLLNALRSGDWQGVARNFQQISVTSGGAGQALKSLSGLALKLVNPFTVGAAAVGVMGLAYYQGSKEADAYSKALILTGNAAGTSATALGAMAANVSKSVGTVGAASTVLMQLAGSSKIPASSFELIATAALKMEDAAGQAASVTVANFEKLSKDPVKYSKELNDQLGYLTAGTYAQIAALAEQGDQQGAANLAEKAYAEALSERSDKIKERLGVIETAWGLVGKAAKGAWDAALDIGREDTFDQKLTKLEDRLQRVRNASVAPNIFDDNPNLGELAAGERGAQSAITDLYVQKAEDERRLAAKKAINDSTKESIESQESLNAALKASDAPAKKLAERYAEIDKQVESARRKGVFYSESQIKQLKEAADQLYKEKKPTTAKSYREDAGQKVLDQARQQYSVLQQQNALIGVQKGEVDKLGASGQALVKWEQELADIKTKKTLTADQKALLASQDLITAQLKKNAGLEKENALRKIASDEMQKLAAFQTNLASQLAKAQTGLDNNLAGMGLGDQTRQRLREQLNIQQQYQTQMDALEQQHNEGRISDGLYSKETDALRSALQTRILMQTEYYSAVDKAQSDWSIGASSAFQTYAEQAADVAGQTRNLFTNAFSNMEDGIIQFVRTGKLSFKDLADGIIADLLRIQIRQAAVGIFGSLFGGIAGGGAAAAGSGTMTGFSETVSRTGFSSGGYTGDGGKFEPKGVVHGGEFVIRKEVVNQPGAREFLERMNANSNGYADGGYVNPTAAASSTSITQSIAPGGAAPNITQEFSFQGKPDDATISLVRDAAYQGAKGGYEMVMRDLRQNGPIRQLIARR